MTVCCLSLFSCLMYGANNRAVSSIHKILANSFISLKSALIRLPVDVRVELHILYPNRVEEETLRLGPTPNINQFADTLLNIVFAHARHLREQGDTMARSIVFSSFNADMCTALNWKQPNCLFYYLLSRRSTANELVDPVLLGNELGADPINAAADSQKVHSSGRTTISVKEAVQVAQNNNLMGLICSSRLLVCSRSYFLSSSQNFRFPSNPMVNSNRSSHLRSSNPSKRPAWSSSQIFPHKKPRSPIRLLLTRLTDISRVKACCASMKRWTYRRSSQWKSPWQYRQDRCCVRLITILIGLRGRRGFLFSFFLLNWSVLPPFLS